MRSPGGSRGSFCHRPRSPAPRAPRAPVLKGATHAVAPTSRKPSQPRASGGSKNPQPCATLICAYCPSVRGSSPPGPPRLELLLVSFLPLAFVHAGSSPRMRLPSPGAARARAQREPRPRSALPAASTFVLSTTPEGGSPALHLAGKAPRRCGLPQVTHPDNTGGGGWGRCSRPTDAPLAALPPTYDIQSLTLPVKSQLETVLCSHPDISRPCPLGTVDLIPLCEHNHVSSQNKTWVITTRAEIHRGQADLKGESWATLVHLQAGTTCILSFPSPYDLIRQHKLAQNSVLHPRLVSAFPVLRLQAPTTMPGRFRYFKKLSLSWLLDE